MKKVLALLAAAALAISLGACSTNNGSASGSSGSSAPSSSGTGASGAASDNTSGTTSIAPATVQVVWWGSDTRDQITLQAIQLFEAAYPQITITPTYMGSDSYWQKLDTQLAGGSAPDVIQFGSNYPDYVAKNQLLSLSPYVGNILDTTNIDADMITAATENNNLYGVCLASNTVGIIYDKTILDSTGVALPAAGYTWDDLTTFLQAIAPKLPSGMYPMTDNSCNNTTYVGYWAGLAGTPLYDGTTTNMTADTFKSYFDMWANWRNLKLIPPADVTAQYTESDASTSSLVAGKVALTTNYSNMVAGLQSAMTDQLGLLPLPDLNSNAAWFQPSQYFCVNAATKVPEASVAFINFFVNSPDVGKVLGTDRGVSANSVVRAAVQQQASASDQQVYDLYAAVTGHTRPMTPNVPNDQQFNDGFLKIGQAVAFGTETTDQASQDAETLLQSMITEGNSASSAS